MDQKTVTVQRANVVLQISPQQIDYYLNQGYDVINDKGEIIQASVPRDLGTLRKAYIEHVAEIEELKEKIKKLEEKRKKKVETPAE